MKKQRMSSTHLGKKLTKPEMKKLVGGYTATGEGECVMCFSDEGYYSCWYTKRGDIALCNAVYPGHAIIDPDYYVVVPSCAGCTMN